MLEITTSNNVPDSTYFRTGSVEPDLKDATLTIYSGTGTRRSSWGEPGTTSTTVLNTDDLAAIHVGFFHKHGGGQFWRYYRNDEPWAQVSWAQLSDPDRERILNAYEDRAPSFAKVPGKLRATYAKPTLTMRTTYKIVEVVGGKYYSVYDASTEYVLGKRLSEKAVSEHGGGYYSYPSIEGVEARFADQSLFPRRCYEESMQLALLECEISGTILSYENRKYASTYIRPLRELKQFEYTPEVKIYA
jgi:hypothetical protein